MVTAIVSHPKSVFDVLAYKNSPTPPMYYGTAHLPTCRAHRSLPIGKAKARWSQMKKDSVDVSLPSLKITALLLMAVHEDQYS